MCLEKIRDRSHGKSAVLHLLYCGLLHPLPLPPLEEGSPLYHRTSGSVASEMVPSCIGYIRSRIENMSWVGGAPRGVAGRFGKMPSHIRLILGHVRDDAVIRLVKQGFLLPLGGG